MRNILSIAALVTVIGCTSSGAPMQHDAVARIWHGRTTDAKAAEYYDYLTTAGVSRFKTIPGNLGVDVMTRSRDGITEFIVISYWRSLDDIKAYAGSDIEKTHNLPRDPEYLIEMEPNVRHFTVRMSERW
ncbi:MAG: antibiotic biosynthesis monooxygenase family protein [Thermoanaerobaculia bacterium]